MRRRHIAQGVQFGLWKDLEGWNGGEGGITTQEGMGIFILKADLYSCREEINTTL